MLCSVCYQDGKEVHITPTKDNKPETLASVILEKYECENGHKLTSAKPFDGKVIRSH